MEPQISQIMQIKLLHKKLFYKKLEKYLLKNEHEKQELEGL
jgi:hypothetical protein